MPYNGMLMFFVIIQQEDRALHCVHDLRETHTHIYYTPQQSPLNNHAAAYIPSKQLQVLFAFLITKRKAVHFLIIFDNLRFLTYFITFFYF